MNTRAQGFTLLEVLIAAMLFTAGMLSLLHIFPVNRRFLIQSANTTQAAFWHRNKLKQSGSLPY